MNKELKIKGFTLVELLVVISIIGILAALVLVSFTGAQKSARDVQRASDLKQFQALLESHANQNDGFYPKRDPITNTSILCGYLGLENCPSDPKNSAPYIYEYQAGPFVGVEACSAGTACKTRYILRARHESNDEYWVVCSNGKSGAVALTTTFSGGSCPL